MKKKFIIPECENLNLSTKIDAIMTSDNIADANRNLYYLRDQREKEEYDYWRGRDWQ